MKILKYDESVQVKRIDEKNMRKQMLLGIKKTKKKTKQNKRITTTTTTTPKKKKQKQEQLSLHYTTNSIQYVHTKSNPGNPLPSTNKVKH